MRRKNSKTAQIGGIFIVAVMAFAAIGASVAHWEETLTINGVMTTDDIHPVFANFVSNDDIDNPVPNQMDPTTCGDWFYHEDSDSWEWINGGRRDKNVGNTDVTTSNDGQTLNVEINDAYPCYFSHVAYMIRNIGSCPVLINKPLLLEELSIQTDPADPSTHFVIDIEDIKLEIGTWYFVKYWKNNNNVWRAKVVEGPVDNQENYDFSIMPTGSDLVHTVNVQLDPWSWRDNPSAHMESPGEYLGQIPGDLCIHFENGCMQDTVYDFKFGMNFYNWPEFSTPPITTITWPEDGIGYIGYEDREGGDFDYNDFGMNMLIQETHESQTGNLLSIHMEFEAVGRLAGDDHDIHMERIFAAISQLSYTVDRSRTAQGTETPAGSYGPVADSIDVILFDTKYISPGDNVIIDIVVDSGFASYGFGTPPRFDLDGIWDFYDPWMKDRTVNKEHHIEDWQAAVSPLPTTGYDVPYILVVPETDWPAPAEQQTITGPYPDFDDYYSTQSSTYEDWYI